MYEIIKKEILADGSIILNEIKAPQIAKKAKAGQFVILRANEYGERIPLTIAKTDTQKQTITVIYMVVGKSTRVFSSLEVGNSYKDITGPLGEPTKIEKKDTILCIGGGTAIAVLHPIAKANYQINNKLITILGAKSKNYLILEDDMKSISNEIHICTDDGSYGHHGFVTDILIDILNNKKVDQVIAIGPVIMMKAVSQITKKYNIPTLVSLNPIMIDGTGMCGGCRVRIDGKIKFACVDGPEFDGHKVDFNGLLRRLNAYRAQERFIDDHYCKLKEQKC